MITTHQGRAVSYRWGPLLSSRTGTAAALLTSIFLLAASPPDLYADHPLDRWTWRFPLPQGDTLRAVTYGNGHFIAVGDNGTIVSSTDGTNWTIQTYGRFPGLLGVGYCDGVYAAVGAAGTILTSSNGVVWSQQVSPTTNTLRAVAGDPSGPLSEAGFLAVGDAGKGVSSRDGKTWLSRPTGWENTLNAVLFRSGLFLVVGDDGVVLRYFPDVGFWATYSAGATNDLRAVAFGDGLYTVGGDTVSATGNSILYSANLTSWGQRTFTESELWQPSNWFVLNGISFGNNRFAAVGDTGHTIEYNYGGVLLVSDTGTNWAELPAPTSENSLYGVTYGNGLFVAVGDGGAILVSSNASDWVEVTPYHRTAITAIACSDTLCIAAGHPMAHFYPRFPDFTTLVSSNGVDWVVSTADLPTLNDLAGAGTQFVGVGTSGYWDTNFIWRSRNCIYTTTNGFNWEENCLSSNVLHGAVHANDRFFVLGDNGTIFSSPDAVNWQDCSVATTGALYSVAYGNNLHVAAGSVAAISRDGVSWMLCPSNPPAQITRMLFADGMFVAVGYAESCYYPIGKILSSVDGTNWQVRSSMPTDITGVAHSSGTFLAIEEYGALIKSLDGTNWFLSQARLPLVDGGIFRIYYYDYGSSAAICAHEGTFIAGGMDGVLMQSGDTRIPILIDSLHASAEGFGFSFLPEIGEPYRILTTTNFETWTRVSEGVGSLLPTEFLDITYTNSQRRFYRVTSP